MTKSPPASKATSGLNYAELLAREIFQGRRTLREIEIELKSQHHGWKTHYAVVRALKKLKRS